MGIELERCVNRMKATRKYNFLELDKVIRNKEDLQKRLQEVLTDDTPTPSLEAELKKFSEAVLETGKEAFILTTLAPR